MPDDISVFVDFACSLADAAGEVIKRHFRQPVEISTKADASPVTVADRDTEARMRALIEGRFPDHGIIGEEFPPLRADAEYVWTLDPVDGTKSFVTGRPTFGVLIALVRAGVPILGIVDHPMMGERWVGAEGRATTHNGHDVRTRACAELSRAALYTSHPDVFRGGNAAAFDRLKQAVGLPLFGGDCYAYGLVASGFADLVVEPELGPDDYFAMVNVIEGAGGVVSDWQGRPLTMGSDGRVLGSGDRRAHDAALALLAGP
jgi:inositol-phosphate phosphatase/L-galactose 1-phosphate phosphatase/histidinol-phosphatase